jgi:long-chain fatty acid transport protein
MQLRHVAFVIFLAGLWPSTTLATNGLNMIGFGTESVAMGGADVAVARDTTALNTNPAGLSNIGDQALDMFSAVAYALDVGHADSFGNDASVDNKLIGLGGFGYARRLRDMPVVLGVGLFAQGGAGNVYKNLATPFGGHDELSSVFRIAKLSFGGAWQPNERLSLGASLALIYADLQQKVFPQTSVAGFSGYRIEGPHVLKPGLKLGVQYRLHPDLTLGASYTTATDLPLTGGHLTANLSAQGLGKVTYSDVRLTGLSLPQAVELGLAWQVNPPLLLSFDLTWLNWSAALKRSQLSARNPDNPAAPAEIVGVSTLNWRDQYVLALGMDYALDARTHLLAGYNYGRNPIPAEHTQPLLAATAEQHLTFGVAHQGAGNWRETFAVEFQPGNTVRYTNPELPFGTSEERNRNVALHFMLSRRW